VTYITALPIRPGLKFGAPTRRRPNIRQGSNGGRSTTGSGHSGLRTRFSVTSALRFRHGLAAAVADHPSLTRARCASGLLADATARWRAADIGAPGPGTPPTANPKPTGECPGSCPGAVSVFVGVQLKTRALFQKKTKSAAVHDAGNLAR
jgi:hypothetical protein